MEHSGLVNATGATDRLHAMLRWPRYSNMWLHQLCLYMQNIKGVFSCIRIEAMLKYYT